MLHKQRNTTQTIPWHIVAHVAQRFQQIRLLIVVQPLRGVRLEADVRTEIVAANHECHEFPMARPIDPVKSVRDL